MPRKPQLTTKQVIIRLGESDPGGKVDLSHVDLTDVDMQDAEIRQLFTRFSENGRPSASRLIPYIDLTGSDISGRDFGGLDLSHFIFSGVIARKTIFARSTMSDTQMDNATADYADFRETDLYHTKLYYTSIRGANFSNAKLHHTHGLGAAERSVMRLGIVHSIKNATLPPQIEPYREAIEEEIARNRAREEGGYVAPKKGKEEGDNEGSGMSPQAYYQKVRSAPDPDKKDPSSGNLSDI